MPRSRVGLLVALTLGLFALGQSRAQATPLSVLIGSSIQCDDKLFKSFEYHQTGDADTPAAQVDVTCIVDGFGNPGLEFAAPWHDNAGGLASDYLIQFVVDVLDPAKRIIDAHLFGNPDSLFDGTALVTEGFGPPALCNPDHLTIFHTAAGSDVSDACVFAAALSTLAVTKDILLDGGVNGFAAISHVDQTFSQTPEPASMLLLATGLAVTARKFRSKKRQ